MTNTDLTAYEVSVSVIRHASQSSWYRHTVKDASFHFCVFLYRVICKMGLKTQGKETSAEGGDRIASAPEFKGVFGCSLDLKKGQKKHQETAGRNRSIHLDDAAL